MKVEENKLAAPCGLYCGACIDYLIYKSCHGCGCNCVGCGECEEKCPYGLPIREMMRENIEYHKRFLEGRR